MSLPFREAYCRTAIWRQNSEPCYKSNVIIFRTSTLKQHKSEEIRIKCIIHKYKTGERERESCGYMVACAPVGYHHMHVKRLSHYLLVPPRYSYNYIASRYTSSNGDLLGCFERVHTCTSVFYLLFPSSFTQESRSFIAWALSTPYLSSFFCFALAWLHGGISRIRYMNTVIEMRIDDGLNRFILLIIRLPERFKSAFISRLLSSNNIREYESAR